MRNIFYTRNFSEKIKEDVNVILSPQFYWIKKIDIPIKNIKEAQKIAPTILKLNEKEYFFKVVKIQNSFFAVAIKKDLTLNIDKKYIKSIRIAQCELDEFDCFNLPNNFSIKKVDGLFFCFPNHFEECMCINNVLEKITLSKCEFNFFDNINLSRFNIILLFLSISFLLIIFLTKGIIYKYHINKLNKEYQKLEAQGVPLTSYQLNSIINIQKYKLSYNNKFRKILNKLQRIVFYQNEFIKSINFNGQKVEVIIKTQRDLDKLFKNYFKDFISQKEKEYYKVVFNVK